MNIQLYDLIPYLNDPIKKFNMSKLISSICIFFSICQFSIGIWEATVAASNAHYNNDNAKNQEMYAFAITKSCCNILSAIVLSFTGAILCCIDPDLISDNNNNSNSKNGLFQVICFGTSIWGLVRFFGPGWDDNLIQSYKDVLIVEMIFFFSVIGLTFIAICTACCGLCFIKEDNESKNKINQITDFDRHLDINNSENQHTGSTNTDFDKHFGINNSV